MCSTKITEQHYSVLLSVFQAESVSDAGVAACCDGSWETLITWNRDKTVTPNQRLPAACAAAHFQSHCSSTPGLLRRLFFKMPCTDGHYACMSVALSV